MPNPPPRIHVYLDVDGVLNAVNINTPPWGWGPSTTHDTDDHKVPYAPPLLQRLNVLAQLPNVSFHWLTTWDERAAPFFNEIGLDGTTWPVVGTTHHYNQALPNWWKLHAIQDHIAATNPDAVVWIDDDIAADIEALQWVNKQSTPVLASSPNCHVGLTRAELAHIEAFLNSPHAHTS